MTHRTQGGVSLVSLLIGVLVGALVLTAAMSSFAFFQGQRRQLVGGDGVLQQGIAGLAELQRAVKSSGATTMNGALLCSTINIYRDGVGTIADGSPTSPVRIVDGGTGSDTLTVTIASSLMGTMPVRVVSSQPPNSKVLQVNTAMGIVTGDLILVGQPASTLPCTLKQVTNTNNTGWGANIQSNPGANGDWNPPNASNAFTTAPSYPAGSVVVKVGNFNWVTYRIVGDDLQMLDNATGATQVIAENVVGMRVWYGTSDGTNRNIEQWIGATGAWVTPTPVQVAAVRAVRIGLVLRNPEHERSSTGGACDTTTNAVLTLWTGGPTFDLSTTGADWSCFRYRTLTLVAPLRNVIYGEQT